MTRPRVILADDHTLVVDGLRPIAVRSRATASFRTVDGVKRRGADANEGSTAALSDAQARTLLEAPPADTLKGRACATAPSSLPCSTTGCAARSCAAYACTILRADRASCTCGSTARGTRCGSCRRTRWRSSSSRTTTARPERLRAESREHRGYRTHESRRLVRVFRTLCRRPELARLKAEIAGARPSVGISAEDVYAATWDGVHLAQEDCAGWCRPRYDRRAHRRRRLPIPASRNAPASCADRAGGSRPAIRARMGSSDEYRSIDRGTVRCRCLS